MKVNDNLKQSIQVYKAFIYHFFNKCTCTTSQKKEILNSFMEGKFDKFMEINKNVDKIIDIKTFFTSLTLEIE